jgi:hypothetical protein
MAYFCASSDGSFQHNPAAIPAAGMMRMCLTPSLRANGSRERALDDRRREAIHRATRKSGLLRDYGDGAPKLSRTASPSHPN